MTREEAKKYLEEVLDGGYVSRLREAAANGGDEFASNMAETVQRSLNTLGIRDNAGNVLTVNGVYDTPTIQAMGKFIRQSGYSGNGVTQYSESRSTGGVNPGYDRITTTSGWTPGKEQSGVYEHYRTVDDLISAGPDAVFEFLETYNPDVYNENFTPDKIISGVNKAIRKAGRATCINWLIALEGAMILKDCPITRELLRYSYSGNSTYVAGNNSALANAMRNDSDLRARLTEIVNGQGNKTSFSGIKIATFGGHDGFEFTTNNDLHYAINGISINTSTVSGRKQANGSWKLSVHIEDVYDYAYMEFGEQSIEVVIVNNVAYCAQEMGVIENYDIIVDFNMELD